MKGMAEERELWLVVSRPDETPRYWCIRATADGLTDEVTRRCQDKVYWEDCRQKNIAPRELPAAYKQMRLFHVRTGLYLEGGGTLELRGVRSGDVLLLGRAAPEQMRVEADRLAVPARKGDAPTGTPHGETSIELAGASQESAAERAPLEPGHSLGRYRIVRRLGKGGQGQVYLAVSPSWEERVLKCLSPPMWSGPEDEARFRREAQLLEAVSHPHLVRCEGLKVDDGRLYLVMEALDGMTLRRVLQNVGGLPVTLFRRFADQLVSAVAALHTARPAPIVHRDLKPENVLVVSDASGLWNLKLLDFGLAKQLGPDRGEGTFSTAVGAPAAGTRMYVPPELLDGKPRELTGDVFTLGAILYEMYHGVLAFPGAGDELWEQIRAAQPARLAATPKALRVVLERCLDPKPAGRYKDAMELFGALREVDVAPERVGRAPSANDDATDRMPREI